MSTWQEPLIVICATGLLSTGASAAAINNGGDAGNVGGEAGGQTLAQASETAPSRPDATGRVSESEPESECDRLKKAGDNAIEMGNYASAENLFLQALKELPKGDLGKESAVRGGLAEALGSQGKLSQSERELKKALSLANKAFGPDSPEAAAQLDGFAWLSEADEKLDKASDYCRQALEIRTKTLKGDDPKLVASLEHMGWIAEKRGMYDEAARNYKQALAIRQATAGDKSVAVAGDMERLAIALQSAGNSREAAPLFAQSMQIKESTGALFAPYQPEAVDKRVIFAYCHGAPNCGSSSLGDSWSQKIMAGGVTLEASITMRPSEFVKTTRVNLRLTNASQRPVVILSSPPMLVALAPKIKFTQPLSAEEVADTIEQKGERKATSTMRNGENAMKSVTSTVYTPRPSYSYCYTPYGVCAQRTGWRGSDASYITTEVPDYAARQAAYEKAAEISARSKEQADIARRNALRPGQVPPGSYTQGSIDFDLAKFDRAVLQVPVGNTMFEFRYDRKKGF
jgi:tetratricopeptide (TPR) repeat protein